MTARTNNNKKRPRAEHQATMKPWWPAIAAIGGACGMAASPAAALELGELSVESTLGQPLRASIAYALNPGESLQDFCIFLKSGTPLDAIPVVSRAAVSVTGNAIVLSGSTPVREPLLAVRLSVSCPYTPRLQRDYTLFVDPAPVASAEPLAATPLASAPPDAASPARRQAPAARSAGPRDRSPIDARRRYRVQPGDSLSGIVARIEDRPPGLWPAVHAVFAMNPDAFIGGDIDLIKAGSWLEFPDFHQPGAEPGRQPAAARPAPAATVPAPAAAGATAYDGYAAPAPATDTAFDSGFAGAAEPREAPPAATIDPPTAGLAATTEAPDTAVSAPRDGLKPGDVFLADDTAVVAPGTAGLDGTADAEARQTAASAAATRPVARATREESWSWLAWLGGAGLAMILGLLLFGRAIRARLAPKPVVARAGEYAAKPAIGKRAARARHDRRHTDRAAALKSPSDVDFEFDDIPAGAAMSLDADLGLGTGLRRKTDIDVAQDFGFSAGDAGAGDMDFELPEHAGEDMDRQPTDIIPPHRREEPSILESEIPPSDDDEDYDLSMIVDATRQPMSDTQLTAKDLQAVLVDADLDDPDGTGGYTLNQQVDFKILEQDYEEELTATQALNAEIARAALELAQRMEEETGSDEESWETETGTYEVPSQDPTAELPRRQDTAITAELTGDLHRQGDAVNDELISDLDDTGINEEINARPPSSDSEVTAEMDIESGPIDTRKSKVS